MQKEYGSYIVAILATVVRYYDYALFGLSASVISKAFMPTVEDNDQMLLFYAVFGASVIARPCGSIIFGKIGDRISRIQSVKISTIIAAISTTTIAFIPTFDSYGWGSVILLTLCRMMFLMSLAGEIDAIRIFVLEKINKKRRNFAIGVVSLSSQFGVMLASLMYHITISIETLQSVWRINFIFGGCLGIVVVMLRGYLKESTTFLNSRISNSIKNTMGIVDLVKKNKLKFLFSILINGFLGGGYNFLIMFLGTFIASVLDMTTVNDSSLRNIVLIVLYGLGCITSGYLADNIDSLNQILFSLMFSIVLVVIMGIFVATGSSIFILHKLLVLIMPFYSIPYIIKIQSQFSTSARMRMYSLSHSLGSMIFSSTTPFVCMLIWRYTGMFVMVLGYFLLQLLLLLVLLLCYKNKPLHC